MKFLMFCFLMVMFLGIVSAIYHTQPSPSPYPSSPLAPAPGPSPPRVAQPLPSPTPIIQQPVYPALSPSPSPFASPSPSSLAAQRQPARQGVQVFNTVPGYWDRAFEEQQYFLGDNINRPEWCSRSRWEFRRCVGYPVFGYPYYQQIWNGPGGRRFWR